MTTSGGRGKWWDDAKVRPTPTPQSSPQPPPAPVRHARPAQPAPPPASAPSVRAGLPQQVQPGATAPAAPSTSTNALAIVALVLGIIAAVGGLGSLAHFGASESARLLAAALSNHVGPLVGVIVIGGLAILTGTVATAQLSRSGGTQGGGVAVTWAYWLGGLGIAAAALTFVIVGGAGS
jgi:hypothetical protein